MNEAISVGLVDLLNRAIARELQVSIQYMFQHAIGASQWLPVSGRTPAAKRAKFVASHAQYWLPGQTLKKVAITEMRHAEAIAERVIELGGEATTEPDPITIGKTAEEMLETDREAEREAIELYGEIINAAEKAGDGETRSLFRRILTDEEAHYRVFSGLLEGT
jgi:bacterioferritin